MSDAPKPSATVVLIREGASALELLLLQRPPRRDGRPGPWVFPGGKVEASDQVSEDFETQARVAAVRETREEAGLDLDADGLVPISRWITPPVAPRRFDTYFFLGGLDPQIEVRVDGVEISDHRWLGPGEALAGHQRGEVSLAPPTFVTVTWLERYRKVADAVAELGRGPVLTFRPRICPDPNGMCMLYPGDAGYEDGVVDRPGARHRLWSGPDGFRYERSESSGS